MPAPASRCPWGKARPAPVPKGPASQDTCTGIWLPSSPSSSPSSGCWQVLARPPVPPSAEDSAAADVLLGGHGLELLDHLRRVISTAIKQEVCRSSGVVEICDLIRRQESNHRSRSHAPRHRERIHQLLCHRRGVDAGRGHDRREAQEDLA